MKQQQPDPVLRGNVSVYGITTGIRPPDESHLWDDPGVSSITLSLFNDGSIRKMGLKLAHIEELSNRPDVVVLVCYDTDGTVPTYTIVDAAEYRAWEAEVQAVGRPANLPPLPRQRKK